MNDFYQPSHDGYEPSFKFAADSSKDLSMPSLPNQQKSLPSHNEMQEDLIPQQQQDLNKITIPETSSNNSMSNYASLLSFKLESLTYSNRYKMLPGESIDQQFLISNDGKVDWPIDTCFVFSGHENHMNAPEEIEIGPTPQGQDIQIEFRVTMPEEVKQERFIVEYEFRHQFQTQSFGAPIKFTVMVKSQAEAEAAAANANANAPAVQQEQDKVTVQRGPLEESKGQGNEAMSPITTRMGQESSYMKDKMLMSECKKKLSGLLELERTEKYTDSMSKLSRRDKSNRGDDSSDPSSIQSSMPSHRHHFEGSIPDKEGGDDEIIQAADRSEEPPAQDISVSGRLNQIQDEIQLRNEVRSKIQKQNRLVEENEAAEKQDKEIAEFQLNVLLSLRRKNLAIMGEQVQKEQTLLEKIILAQQSVTNDKVKLETKLKKERESLQKQKEELEHQLLMVKRNRNDRLEAVQEQHLAIAYKKKGVKKEINEMLSEHHACLKELISNLAELHQIEGSDVEVSRYIQEFIQESGNAHLLNAIQFLQQHNNGGPSDTFSTNHSNDSSHPDHSDI